MLAGNGIPVHRHFEMDEAFYVIGGSGTFILNYVPHPIGEGTTIFIPKNVWHGFQNPDRDKLNLLWIRIAARPRVALPRNATRPACRQSRAARTRSTRLRAVTAPNSGDVAAWVPTEGVAGREHIDQRGLHAAGARGAEQGEVMARAEQPSARPKVDVPAVPHEPQIACSYANVQVLKNFITAPADISLQTSCSRHLSPRCKNLQRISCR